MELYLFIFEFKRYSRVKIKTFNNPDNFAIARFDMNTLTYNQVANNVYNIKLKIREVW